MDFSMTGLEDLDLGEVVAMPVVMDIEEDHCEPIVAWHMWVSAVSTTDWQYKCIWEGCAECDMGKSIERLSSHLIDVHFPNVQDVALCGVSGCDFQGSGPAGLYPHLQFHLYHASLQATGVKYLNESNIGVCDQTPEIYNAFGNQLWTCNWDDCERQEANVATFFAHVKSHIDDLSLNGQFRCVWHTDAVPCHSVFARRSSLRHHMHHHTGEKAVACPSCGKFFANATKLKDHLNRQFPNDEAHKCLLCHKHFTNERLLKEHSRKHVKRVRCPYCSMTVTNESELRWHIQHRHANTHLYKCNLCQTGFNSQGDLTAHYAKHSHIATHQCPHCPKKYKWKMSLTAHLRQHIVADTKIYMCHLCPKQYSAGRTLGLHLSRIHSITLPSGYSRFTFKNCADGYRRLQTDRYEILNPKTFELEESPQNLVPIDSLPQMSIQFSS